jgi:hypothetical protein
MATCVNYYDTSVSFDNRRKYFCGDAFNCAPILPVFFSERTLRGRSRIFNKQPVVRN